MTETPPLIAARAGGAMRLLLCGRILIAGIGGVACGNLLWFPYIGVLMIPILAVSLAVSAPLMVIGIGVALIAPRSLHAHPLLWTGAVVTILIVAFVLFDPPVNRAALERLALLTTVLACASAIYRWLPVEPARTGETS